MLTAREGGKHVRGVRGFPRENFDFLALLCAFLIGFMRSGPDFSHIFLLEMIFLGV